uniref:CGL160/ATPI domain-containing protein n=1 Tax=Eutreptiella gymnastica TaxID=73025 RepID=A0A7S4D0Z1_9EUGL
MGLEGLVALVVCLHALRSSTIGAHLAAAQGTKHIPSLGPNSSVRSPVPLYDRNGQMSVQRQVDARGTVALHSAMGPNVHDNRRVLKDHVRLWLDFLRNTFPIVFVVAGWLFSRMAKCSVVDSSIAMYNTSGEKEKADSAALEPVDEAELGERVPYLSPSESTLTPAEMANVEITEEMLEYFGEEAAWGQWSSDRKRKTGEYKEPDPEKMRQNVEAYAALKRDLILLTGLFALVLFAVACALKGRDVGLSVGVGGLGSVLYCLLLSRKADGDQTAPTLLIPAALFALALNWDSYEGVERFGFELELLPLILGFLSYRFAVIVVTFRDSMTAFSVESNAEDSETGRAEQ